MQLPLPLIKNVVLVGGARARTGAKEMGDEAGGWRASDSGQPITDCALHGNVA